uniref:Fibronectin type-III domain-containing protein n=1 Tax=Timema shepardi TaxID=629360 RepID=A0A7R9G311_TIMSH|nr:unnamed protein product [Timema shepardi]
MRYKVGVKHKKATKIVTNLCVSTLDQTPSKVSSLETQSVGPTVFVTWTPPSQLSWCVAQYEICWGSSPDDQNCTVQANNVTTFNITELTPCGEYVVGVRSLGQAGNSSQVNTTVTAAPEPARNLNFPFINTTFIEADWEAPGDQSDCIDYYQVCMTVFGETACVNQTRDITTTSYPELRPCTSLTVDVTAWTEGAHSSVMSEQVNTRDEVPDVPTHLHVNYAEVDKVNLEWHAPVANPECVEWYQVCWKGGQIESCNNATDIQDLISGLAPCGDYSANVTAVGAAGKSATSHLVVHTRNTAFNEIYILEVKSSDSTTLEVEWKAPFKNSECVQEYEVCWLGQETGEKGCTIQTTATTKATITGLISCVNYTVNVTAKGVLKNSTAVSMPVMTNSTLIQDKPAIQNVSLSRDSEGNITVTWHPLVEEMMCVRSYNVCWEQQSQPKDSQCLELPSSEDHLTISGLHSGTTYTVEVSADLVTGETSEIIREDIPISGSFTNLTSPIAIVISLVAIVLFDFSDVTAIFKLMMVVTVGWMSSGYARTDYKSILFIGCVDRGERVEGSSDRLCSTSALYD